MKATDLLAHGYFAKQLPIGFNIGAWGNSVAKKALPLPGKYPECPLLTHVVNRPGQLPRVLGIPHPYHFHTLAEIVEANWTALRHIWSKSSISLSIPRIGERAKGERACEPTEGWRSQPERALERRQGRKVMLKADISQCYPSVYTHAVSWAIQGKAAAVLASKSKGGPIHFADQLDKAIRDGQERQSVGLPIGPDTSFLITETILSTVDEILQSRIANLQGTRVVDDYELYFDNTAQAEQAKIVLAEALATYKLLLNRSKTRVVELPVPLEPSWKRELSAFRFGGNARWAKKQVRAATDLCYRQRQSDPDSRSITYLLTMFASCKFHADVWPLIQTTALASMEFEENSIPRAARLFFNAAAKGWPVDKSNLGLVLNRLVIKHNALRFGNAVAWSLSIMIHLDIPIAAEAISSSIATDDAVVLTVLAHAKSKGLAKEFKINATAKLYLSTSCWCESQWLFLYECVRHGWLGASTGAKVEASLKAEPYMSALNKRGVSFYEETASWNSASKEKAQATFSKDAHAFSQIELISEY